MNNPFDLLDGDQQRAIAALAAEWERPEDMTLVRLIQIGMQTVATYPGINLDLAAFLAEVTMPERCD